jgi:uncharacterized Rmd1/YagE family protein
MQQAARSRNTQLSSANYTPILNEMAAPGFIVLVPVNLRRSSRHPRIVSPSCTQRLTRRRHCYRWHTAPTCVTSVEQQPESVALQTNRVASLCVASEIDVAALSKRLERQQRAHAGDEWASASMGASVLRMTSRDGTVCFVFGWGCFVVWSGSEKCEAALTQLLVQDSVGANMVPYVDAMSWRQVESGASKIEGDVITLSQSGECGVLERLAVSFALGQSVKLTSFEHAIQDTIARTRKLPQEMAEHGRVISARRSDIAAMTGALFMHRLSLESVTSRPSFFWATENVNYLTNYSRVSAYMELDERNARHAGQLNALQDLLELVATAESLFPRSATSFIASMDATVASHTPGLTL